MVENNFEKILYLNVNNLLENKKSEIGGLKGENKRKNIVDEKTNLHMVDGIVE